VALLDPLERLGYPGAVLLLAVGVIVLLTLLILRGVVFYLFFYPACLCLPSFLLPLGLGIALTFHLRAKGRALRRGRR